MIVRHLNVIVVIVFALALILGAFFALSAFRILRETQPASLRSHETRLLVGAELDALLPSEHVGTIAQELIDFDGDGKDELVVGYAVQHAEISESRTLPRLRVFREQNERWIFVHEFAFSIEGYRNQNDWRVLEGSASFEKKDIDGDRKEELFIQLGMGSEFFRAMLVVVMRDGKLMWLPMIDQFGIPILPIFREGGTSADAWHMLLEDVNGGGGLEIVRAYGQLNSEHIHGIWEYQVYVESGGVYQYDVDLSDLFTASGQTPVK